MANPSAEASKSLAKNILDLRKKQALSQGELAKLAGIPRSTLTHLESGNGNPSLQNLIRVAGALQVTIEELLAKPRSRCKLVRAGDTPVQKRAHGAASLFKLLPDPIPGMELDRLELDKGARMGGIPHSANTKEFLVCISGKVQVHVEGEAYWVESGDVLAFPGDQHHSYMNAGTGRASCLSVVVLAPAGI